MNIPNVLTIVRIFFVPLLVAALVQQDVQILFRGIVFTNDLLALCIFLVAAATDLLDGYLARRWGQVTTIGTLLDPIADKLLVSAALISLVQIRAMPAWMVVLIIGREFAVSGLRSIAAAEGYTIAASDLGKTKTLSQVAAISAVLLSLRHSFFLTPAYWLLWAVVIFSILSALDYFWKFWRRVDDQVKNRRRRELLIMARLERRKRLAALRQRSGSGLAGGTELGGGVRETT
jgi:CDP-diacylglycerol---glycerol-3-phosphate 3-phosphatidyltransferase